MTEKKSNGFGVALILGVSIIICSLILAFGMKNIIKNQRTVSVRGLSEKEVDADLAVWKLSFSLGGNNLEGLQAKIIEKNQIVIEYLNEFGLTDKDFSVLAPEITDATMNMYLDSNRRTYDYVAKQSFLIRTGNVEAVKSASSETLVLLGKGISVSSDYDNKVQYYFNGLNDIKPEMIAEATESARKAAEKFAKDSGSKVGKIQTATQGLFSIEDAAPGLENKKNVRVVTTVVYSLVD